MMWSSLCRGLFAALIVSVSILGCARSKVSEANNPKQCDTAADCCPAQTCKPSEHYCLDNFIKCPEGSCPAQGQVCKTIGVFVPLPGCTWNKCQGGACGSGTSCFNSYCVSEPPCSGGCGAGKVCITATNLCSPTPKDSSCQQTCPAGKMLVLQDPDNIFDTCKPDTEKCECDSLPPIQVRDVARYSSIAASGQYLYVSAYDGVYGDLVVHTFDKAALDKPQKSEWVDGVPATGHIGGDVNGPRGGITDPGPNVGQYTSIAADAQGDVYVAYYDVDNGDLKFTARYGGPAAKWTPPMTVDGSTPAGSAPSNGDVGMYASIALDKNGIPAIAYFRRGSYDAAAGAETGPSTALVYAVAKKAQPSTKDDWTVVGDVEQANRPAPPCNNACTGSQICIADPNAAGGERCATSSTAQCVHVGGSAPGCTGTQACVLDTDPAQTPVCRTTEAAQVLAELPPGTGLMPSLAFIDEHPVIAWYDSINRVVKAVMGTGGAAAPAFGAPVEIDGHDTAPLGQPQPRQRDTGRWPALAIGPSGAAGGRIAIAFADLTLQQLLIYQSDGLTSHAAHAAAGAPGLIHVVDDGRPDAGGPWHPQSLPGAQASIAFTPSGKIALAYQDATPVDLIFATWDPTQNKLSARSTLRAAGAAGFWPKLAIVSGTAYVSSATIKAATLQIPANALFVDAKAAP